MHLGPLIVGLSDAIGFVGGTLLGFGLGRLLGCDIFEPGYRIPTLIGLALVGFGGGLGLQLAHRWRQQRTTQGE